MPNKYTNLKPGREFKLWWACKEQYENEEKHCTLAPQASEKGPGYFLITRKPGGSRLMSAIKADWTH